MSGPPPPPPPLALNLSATSGANNQGRNLLLQSIRSGKTLKKTVTNDKSAPCVSGRVRGESSNVKSNESNSVSNTNSGSNITSGNATPMGLGGLFSSGMPKLKPTGLRANMCEKDSSSSSTNSNSMINLSPSLTHTVKRGPPPIPPPATQKPQVFSHQIADTTNNTEESKSFGKPTLAPKPPPLPSVAPQKPSPPPKKLNLTSNASVSRAQSMRLPRSPPVLAPTPHSLHQSQDCLNENQSRPTNRILRPPVVRPPSPPTSKTSSNVTVTRVAPPPPSRVTVIPPLTPPPPPPVAHRPPTHQRLAPPPPPPPTPPTRSSSMRNGQTPNFVDLETRFGELFHSQSSFPPPEPFKGFQKTYSSRNAAKQQAPPPPMQSSPNPNSMLPLNLSSEGKQWQSNTTSLAC